MAVYLISADQKLGATLIYTFSVLLFYIGNSPIGEFHWAGGIKWPIVIQKREGNAEL